MGSSFPTHDLAGRASRVGTGDANQTDASGAIVGCRAAVFRCGFMYVASPSGRRGDRGRLAITDDLLGPKTIEQCCICQLIRRQHHIESPPTGLHAAALWISALCLDRSVSNRMFDLILVLGSGAQIPARGPAL